MPHTAQIILGGTMWLLALCMLGFSMLLVASQF